MCVPLGAVLLWQTPLYISIRMAQTLLAPKFQTPLEVDLTTTVLL